MEEELRRAVYELEAKLPPQSVGLLLLAAVPSADGSFDLRQVGNVTAKTAGNMLVAALQDIAYGKWKIKEKL